MPYILMRRTDIEDGLLQVVDLKPNTSLRTVYDPGMGQTGYVKNIPQNQTVATTGVGPIITNADYCGLAAYLIDRVADSSGTAITAAVANTTSAAMIAVIRAGTALTVVIINAALVAAGATAGTSLIAGGSTGTLAQVLFLLQGAKYFLPGGAEVEDVGNNFVATIKGYFDPAYTTRTYYDTGAFKISFGEGNLSDLLAATFEYQDVAGAAITVLADDGSIYTP